MAYPARWNDERFPYFMVASELMKTRLLHLWDSLFSSYWFIPALMLLGALLLASTTLVIDGYYLDEPPEIFWLYTGGAEGARTLLSTVAGSIITVAGVAFSITIAALSQASSQFGPRILRNFMRDRGNQLVLGTFVATFLFCLLVLRSVRGGENSAIPHVSVTTAVILAIASLCVLVYFIHHVSASMQAPLVIARAWSELKSTLEHVYPESLGTGGPAPHRNDEKRIPSDPFVGDYGTIKAEESGYIQAIDVEGLMKLAETCDLRMKVLQRPGKFVIDGSTLVQVWPADAANDVLRKEVNEAFIVGKQRTAEQDIEYAIHQMVEIAVRALSPGINDPFTAVTCIDWIAESICRIAGKSEQSSFRYGRQREIRMVTRVSSFRGIVDAGFDQIRQCSAQNVAVTIRLLEAITAIAEHVAEPGQCEALFRQLEMIYRQSSTGISDPYDRADVDGRYREAMGALQAAKCNNISDDDARSYRAGAIEASMVT
ncbi:MAG: DUF2254 domain-containing protein [Deltaproteobacteria bacterium]|nr:DUF2254 domain-containing protein [Deltaproteobacteria bacterium]